jgi:hypothetical protein
MTIKRVLRALLDYRVRDRSQAAASRGRP